MENTGVWACIFQCQRLLHDIDKIANGHDETLSTFVELQAATNHLIGKDEVYTEWGTRMKSTPPEFVVFFYNLAKHAYDALIHEPEYFTELMQILALFTRNLEWTRRRFGVFTDELANFNSEEPRTVLEVASLACTLKFAVESAAIEASLRIVNNCCSEDDDINRTAFIRHDGISLLLDLALHETNLELLIPTLYTVCMDNTVPSTVLSPPSAYLSTDATSENGEIDNERPSLAIESLGAAHRLTNNFMTFELLLSLESKVTEETQELLVELIQSAVQPALSGFEHVRKCEAIYMDPWCFRCRVGGQEYDTIYLVTKLAASSVEHMLCMSRVVLNLLSQQPARDALLRRQDESLLSLLTIACMHDDDELLQSDDKEEVVLLRKAFLKLLYQLSGSEAFLMDEVRPPIIIASCLNRLEEYTESTSTADPRWSSHRFWSESASNFTAASACVVLAQYAGSQVIGDNPVTSQRLFSMLLSIFEKENRPDILYPALTIVSRALIDPAHKSLFLNDRGLQSVSRLLVQQGLGLIVPFEAVTIFKTAIRGRPDILRILVVPGNNNTAIVDSIFRLWGLTFDAGTKLEIGKFFMEMLRTILPMINARDRDSNSHTRQLLDSIDRFLLRNHSTSQISRIFAWMCLNAEPVPQREHGWFGLAMLSTLSSSYAVASGLLHTIESDQGLRDAILTISQMEDGPVRRNLALLVAKLRESPELFNGNGTAKIDTLKTAANNLGLPRIPQDDFTTTNYILSP